MAKILVTGGPVHASLDSVKIVTNRFKGGRMIALAEELGKRGHDVVYLTARHLVKKSTTAAWKHMKWCGHNGFYDYIDLVLKCASESDMTILGAAVANLIPVPSWPLDQKFPSHDYSEGDIVNIPFKVAPRVINMIKKHRIKTTLVGFKLLQGVSQDELVRAAHTVVSESGASFVIANDASDLNKKFIVTRERSVIPAVDVVKGTGKDYVDYFVGSDGRFRSMGVPPSILDFLDAVARDEHYKTVPVCARGEFFHNNKGYLYFRPDRKCSLTKRSDEIIKATDLYWYLIEKNQAVLENSVTAKEKNDDYIFGCVAVAVEGGGFMVSPRGKKNLDDPPVFVKKVDHEKLQVFVSGGKASLNAPLLDNLFKMYCDGNDLGYPQAIVHTHEPHDNRYPSCEYAPAGTLRDSQRKFPLSLMPFKDRETIFWIEHHGKFQVFRKGEL